MIGTNENRAVLYVEVTFWSGKRKAPPSLVKELNGDYDFCRPIIRVEMDR